MNSPETWVPLGPGGEGAPAPGAKPVPSWVTSEATHARFRGLSGPHGPWTSLASPKRAPLPGTRFSRSLSSSTARGPPRLPPLPSGRPHVSQVGDHGVEGTVPQSRPLPLESQLRSARRLPAGVTTAMVTPPPTSPGTPGGPGSSPGGRLVRSPGAGPPRDVLRASPGPRPAPRSPEGPGGRHSSTQGLHEGEKMPRGGHFIGVSALRAPRGAAAQPPALREPGAGRERS